MKVNNLSAIDYKITSDKLIIYFKDTSTEVIARLNSSLLTVTTNSGELVESFTGYQLKAVEYNIEKNEYIATYVQKLNTDTEDYLLAVNKGYDTIKKELGFSNQQVEELKQQVNTYSQFLTSFGADSNKITETINQLLKTDQLLVQHIDILYEIFDSFDDTTELKLLQETLQQTSLVLEANKQLMESLSNWKLETEQRIGELYQQQTQKDEELKKIIDYISQLHPETHSPTPPNDTPGIGLDGNLEILNAPHIDPSMPVVN